MMMMMIIIITINRTPNLIWKNITHVQIRGFDKNMVFKGGCDQ